MESNCIYCGHELVPYGHWGICPECEPQFVRAIEAPRLKFSDFFPREWLNLEKGRPWRNGKPS